jgi:hypothetical protein
LIATGKVTERCVGGAGLQTRVVVMCQADAIGAGLHDFCRLGQLSAETSAAAACYMEDSPFPNEHPVVPGQVFDKGLPLFSIRRMPALLDDFQHCLSSSLFLLNRDATLRLYRPEDFGHQPLRKSLLSKIALEILREQVGLEASGRS